MKITARKYISNSSDTKEYVSVFKYNHDRTDRRVSKEGDVYSVIKISSEGKVNAERMSKFVWDSIVDGYLYSTAKTTNESLKEAIDSGVNKVKSLIANNKEIGEVGVDVEFTIILIKEEGVYVGVLGENEIYALKSDSFVNITDALVERKANTAGIALGEDDVLMVSTGGVLSLYLDRLSVVSKKEDIVRMLESVGENLGGSSAILLFSDGLEERKERKASPIVMPKPSDMKNFVKKNVKPIARVERLKKPTDLKLFENPKVKEFVEKGKVVGGKIAGIFKKVLDFVGKYVDILKEKIVGNLGKKRWYKKIAARMSEVRIVKRKPSGVAGMRIDDYKFKDLRSRRFKLILGALAIIVLLALGVNFTIKARQAREISRLASEKFVQIEDLLGQVEESFSVDKESAETYLFQAENALDEVPEGLNEEDIATYQGLEKKILELGDALYKRVGVSEELGNLISFVNTRLSFGEGSEVVDIASYVDGQQNEYLVVADAGRSTVYRVSVYDKSVKAIPDDEGLVTSLEQVYVGVKGIYAYDSEVGMVKSAFNEDGEPTSFFTLSGLGSEDVKSTDISEMTVWTLNDNVYFLSKDRGALLKSTLAYGDRYGLAYPYLEHESMSLATDMVADLSIYIIVPENPSLVRFNYSFYEAQFQEAALSTLGFDGNYGTLTKAYTSDSLDYGLYLFDSEGRRFLRFEKPVESGLDTRHPNQILLIYQYLYRGGSESIFSDVKNFVVDSSEEYMYILDGSDIWRLGL